MAERSCRDRHTRTCAELRSARTSRTTSEPTQRRSRAPARGLQAVHPRSHVSSPRWRRDAHRAARRRAKRSARRFDCARRGRCRTRHNPYPRAGLVSELIDRALDLYRSEPRSVRAYLRLRRRLLPLAKLDADLPREKSILDLACGHGLWPTCSLSARRPRDPRHRSRRIPDRVAKTAARPLANVSFETGELTGFPHQACAGSC